MRNTCLFAVLHIMVFLVAINANGISVALDHLSSDLKAGIVLVSWVIGIYQLVATVGAVVMGRVCDILGKKRAFLLCSFLFTLGAFAASVAPNIYILIFSRFIQSLGGGGIIPVVTAVIAELYPQSRQRVLGFSMAVFMIGSMVGPGICAFLVNYFGWRYLFGLNIVPGILVFTYVLVLQKKDTAGQGRIDPIGVLFLSMTIVALILPFSLVTSSIGGRSVIATILLVCAMLSLSFFLRHQKQSDNPVVDVHYLAGTPFNGVNLFNMILGGSVFGFTAFFPLFAVKYHHLSILQSGYLLTLRSFGVLLMTFLVPPIVSKWNYRLTMICGLLLSGVPLFCMLIRFGPDNLYMVYLYFLSFVAGIGYGMLNYASVNATIDLLVHRVALISGIRSMFFNFGGAAAVALIALVLDLIGQGSRGFGVAFVVLGAFSLVSLPIVSFFPDKPATE